MIIIRFENKLAITMKYNLHESKHLSLIILTIITLLSHPIDFLFGSRFRSALWIELQLFTRSKSNNQIISVTFDVTQSFELFKYSFFNFCAKMSQKMREKLEKVSLP